MEATRLRRTRVRILTTARTVLVRTALLTIPIAILAASSLLAPGTSHALPGEPFLHTGPVVVIADREVCSLLSAGQKNAGIVGLDGGASLRVGDTEYWNFGDTILSSGGMLPNTIATSTDDDASDCIQLMPKTAGGSAVPLLGLPNPSKLTVWPMGMEQTAPGTVHFFFASVVSKPTTNWRVQGVGLASFDPSTLAASPAFGGSVIWPDSSFMPSHTVSDGGYVYLLLDKSRSLWTTDTILARVPAQSIETLSAYEYWDASTGQWLQAMWDAGAGSWSPTLDTLSPLWSQFGMHNGVDIAYNTFLGKWLAVYTTNFMTTLNVRTADSLSGPWESQDAVMVDCRKFHPVPQELFQCYTGTQHESFARDGGRTIYVSFSNSDSYQVYLHEVRLASPVAQWNDGNGRVIYQTSKSGPPGFGKDGVAFFASDIPVPGLTGIHRWEDKSTGATRYGATAPGSEYTDLGNSFYAPLDGAAAAATNVPTAPVFEWSRGGDVRYSPLNLGPAGFTQQSLAFYAPCPDTDGDGWTDCSESSYGTNPASADTDGDTLRDKDESTAAGCDPLVYNPDDGDGFSLFEEQQWHTSPCLWDSGAFGCAQGAVRPASCITDSDGDGCPDAVELGPSQNAGGRRSNQNRWDFYDVNGDHVVTMREDLLAVIRSFGSAASYTQAKDRRPPPPASMEPDPAKREPWDVGAPDGGISMLDVLAVAKQYGHTCLPLH